MTAAKRKRVDEQVLLLRSMSLGLPVRVRLASGERVEGVVERGSLVGVDRVPVHWIGDVELHRDRISEVRLWDPVAQRWAT